MLNGVITYHHDQYKPSVGVTIGSSEEVKAPRVIKPLEEKGWVITDDVTNLMLAFLAAQRQGDIPRETDFETWSETVLELNLHVTEKQLKQAVVMGNMSEQQAQKLREAMALDEGEAAPPRD